MRNLVLAIFDVMPRMLAIMVLLVLLLYIFAVLFTSLFKDIEDLDKLYFSHLGWSTLTLFQMMTFDNWSDICRETMEHKSWAWIPFVIFIVISGFMVINLVIAVVCDAISDQSDDKKAGLYGLDANELNDEEDSVVKGEALRSDIQKLENQVEALIDQQERTMHTLKYLMRHIQMQNADALQG